MKIQDRIRLADLAMESATVSMERLAPSEIELANKLCQHFDLPIGTLLRTAAAIEIIGGEDSATDRLREAAQHLNNC